LLAEIQQVQIEEAAGHHDDWTVIEPQRMQNL